jgi:hypothetical protein
MASQHVPEVMDALTDMIYAIAKNVAKPALTSVKNLDPFLSNICPENSRRNRRPIKLLATAMFVFVTWVGREQTTESFRQQSR